MQSGSAATLRRLKVLHRILSPAINSNRTDIQRHLTSASGSTFVDGKITIDGIERQIQPPKNPEFVPLKYLNRSNDGNLNISQTNLHHLRWMLQKDQLGQDMFLIGRPGPMRRHIAMQYLQLTQRELEYVSLSRDTTESDLKQRREIQDGTAIYFDQCAVRAATEGRILIIEGVEKAERNVLPILNNLLENREMHLEDGKLLIPAERYDKLLKEHGKSELDKWGLVRVSENFRVIALGLPVPKYRGAPLDPPLRSRFQAREITNLSYQELLRKLTEDAPNAHPDSLKKLVTFCCTVSSPESNLPDFPTDNLAYVGQILNENPNLSVHNLIYRLYPYNLLLPKEEIQSVQTLLSSLDISTEENHQFEVEIKKEENATISTSKKEFIETKYQSKLLQEILQSYKANDLCLVGPKGSGKSALVYKLAKTLGQQIEPMVLYQDMIARDFIQQRTTNVDGDTQWRNSPLITAAQKGHIVVLDGIHRVHSSALSFLHRLVHDREIHLYDGTRLLRSDKYNELLESGLTPNELEIKRIFSIHPKFRIIALAEPPTLDAGSNWITPEILSLFLFHEIRYLNRSEELEIIKNLYDIDLTELVDLAHLLRQSNDPILKGLSSALSTRQILRIAQKLSLFPPEKSSISSILSFTKDKRSTKFMDALHNATQRAFLSKFLPPLPKVALDNALRNIGIQSASVGESKPVEIFIDGDTLRIGETETSLHKTEAVTKVPDILFYNVPQHVQLMEYLLQDFLLGNNILLVGNQGVGKNKIADRLLQLMNRPREYIQLHRDTTVQTLTLQPSIQDGIVYYEDSPLVKAVKYGHTLIVDEADKAPTHVTCILKTLVEDGEMILSDGRKILPCGTSVENDVKDAIVTHPDFRMIVLANRPGFPFLGNDFYAALGDLFSCYAVDNPSIESEIYLLQQYGPDVPRGLLVKFVNAFAELRHMADTGQLSYPYSTREVVNIVKHLQTYPNEDLSELIGNVLDFDRFSPESLEQVIEVLQKHGLAIESYAKNELNALRRKREIQVTVESKSGKSVSGPKHGKEDPDNKPHVGGNTWAGGTGGRDTAGLGGKGGPYRLDKGHKVHQLSDEEKNDLPDHVKDAVREMNRKAFEEKLKEIKMSKYDHSIYEQYRTPVNKQIQQLRIVLNSLQAKKKERHWVRHRTSGELDDNKLIEGITGEKNIYRLRADQDPEMGQPQEKPKRLRLLVDVSGSMYRFNGYDNRLERQLELVVMVMEAFQGFESRVQYDIIGHSGETHHVPFVTHNNPPKNEKLRLETIKMMHAHSQFCWSGDNTVSGIKHSVKSLATEDCDEAIVVAISDANLSRYGIPPQHIADALNAQEPKVQAYVIFIGSLENEAHVITRMLPAGKAFVCMDLDKLPQILGHIFASSILKRGVE